MSAKPSKQTIWYTLYTKDSVSQSMRTKGAVNSLDKIEDFLKKAAVSMSHDAPSIEFDLFGLGWKERKYAKKVYETLKAEYGKPTESYSSFKITALLWGMQETNLWQVEPEQLREVLRFIDDLGPLPELSSRPPVYVTVSYKFWLKHPDISSQDRDMESYIGLFLSPSSNTVNFSLGTPFEKDDAAFRKFRENLQKECPFELKDKYFYIRKFNKKGEEFYRRLYVKA